MATESDVLQPMAKDVLGAFASVEEAAQASLNTGHGVSVESMASINTFTTPQVGREMNRLNDDRCRSAKALCVEPAIARVDIEDSKGVRRTYYVCTAMPAEVQGLTLVSYRTPVGELAAKSPGDAVRLPNGETVEVIRKIVLRPQKTADWDSVKSQYFAEDGSALTIESLRALLVLAPEGEDLLAAILAAADSDANVVRGLRRSVITKMGLREQPVLDSVQDRLFRLPLASRLVLLGPPGTGKTTTLIHRVGQKQDRLALLEGEDRPILERIEADGLGPVQRSWLMFTPTRLLQQYVKEAFAREGIGAPETHIVTWESHSWSLGRDVLRILRSESAGIFVLKANAQTLQPGQEAQQSALYDDFEAWQRKSFIENLQQAADELSKAGDASLQGLAERALAVVASNATAVNDPVSLIVELSRESPALLQRIGELKEQVDAQLRSALVLQLNRNRNFLSELAEFLKTLDSQDVDDSDDAEEMEDAEADDDEADGAGAVSQSAQALAKRAYERAVRSLARSLARGRTLRKTSRGAQILSRIGEDCRPAKEALLAMGRSLIMQSLARRLTLPANRYVLQMPRRYRTFRRVRQSEGGWYASGTAATRDLHALELDVLVLAGLRASNGLLRHNIVRRNLADSREWAAVRDVREVMRIQILVDEATDFSPVQLSCMALLSHPEVDSFFACGDFNQRLTKWGTRSESEFAWAVPGISHERVQIGYRQSSQLNELAKSLVRLGDGDQIAVQLPQGVDSDGFKPTLGEDLATDVSVAAWLSARIAEIERFLKKKLPSIAVLTVSEDAVDPLAKALQEQLANRSILVEPCHEGQTVGSGDRVRVFDVRHIKGMEFEAVFFVGVDELVSLERDLFDKYLYVGATRAAMYLGITCHGTLPQQLEALRSQFAADWAEVRQ